MVIAYIKACTFSMTGLVALFYVLTNGASVGSNFWLAHWSNQESASRETGTEMYARLASYVLCLFVTYVEYNEL